MTYVVKSGDSLSAIARDELGNIDLWQSIAKLNGINAPYVIQPGQILELPPPAPAQEKNLIAKANSDETNSWRSTEIVIVSLLGVGILAFILLNKKKKKS